MELPGPQWNQQISQPPAPVGRRPREATSHCLGRRAARPPAMRPPPPRRPATSPRASASATCRPTSGCGSGAERVAHHDRRRRGVRVVANWPVGLTLAIIAGIAHAIWRSRSVAAIATGGPNWTAHSGSRSASWRGWSAPGTCRCTRGRSRTARTHRPPRGRPNGRLRDRLREVEQEAADPHPQRQAAVARAGEQEARGLSTPAGRRSRPASCCRRGSARRSSCGPRWRSTARTSRGTSPSIREVDVFNGDRLRQVPQAAVQGPRGPQAVAR